MAEVAEHERAARRLDAAVLDPALAGGLAISDEARREVLDVVARLLAGHQGPTYPLLGKVLDAARAVLRRYQPFLAELVTDAQLAAWLGGGRDVLHSLPPPAAPPGQVPPPAPPAWVAEAAGGGEAPLVRFDIIEAAAKDLAARDLLSRPAFDAAGHAARLRGFTVANVATLDALARVRDALADAILEGGTRADFAAQVDAALGKSALSPAHLETVFRTGVLGSYSRGQVAVLRQPLVASAFTHVAWHAIHDSRCRPDHLAMETAGIDGTNIYRFDDPELRRVWPPGAYNCRCAVVLLTLERAARRGCRDAVEWLKAGLPPEPAPYVSSVPLISPPGWVSAWDAQHLAA